MKFLELHLQAYGPFTDHVIDFSQNSFHLIFGPNEAGKSTTLRAIDGLLFGIPNRTEDNFVHKYTDMKIGAKIRNHEDRELGFVRRKKQKKSLVRLDAPEKTLAENVLDAYLKGMERDRFNRLFCINHDEFREGGELMRELKGLANESLVAASHGSGFGDVESSLSTEAAELWSKRGRATQIRKLVSEYDEAKSDRQQHKARAAEWQLLNDELEAHRQRKKKTADETAELRTQQNRLKRLLQALPLVTQWKSLNAQLAEHNDVKVLPESYSAKDRVSCAADFSSATTRLKSLDEKLCTLDSEIESAATLPEVLAASEQIDALQQQIASYVEAKQSLANDKLTCETKLKDVQRWLNELDVTRSPDKSTKAIEPKNADALFIKSEIRAAIEDLCPQEPSLRERPALIEREQRETQRELDAIKKQRETLGRTVDTRPLSAAIGEASSHLSLERKLVDLKKELATKRSKIQVELQRLPGWNGSFEELVRSKIPQRETVDHFAKRRVELESQLESNEKQLKETERELRRTRSDIKASQRASAVVTETDLQASRANRELGWSLIKKTMFAGQDDPTGVQQFAGADSLDAAYEQHVAESDNIADRLRREAKRVGELTKQQERESNLAEEVAQLQTESEALHGELTDLEKEWQQVWRSGGVDSARSPREMGAWLDTYASLLAKAEDVEAVKSELTTQKESLVQKTAALQKAVAAFDNELNSDSIATLHAHAEELLETHRTRDAERERLLADERRLQEQLEDLASELEQAKRELDSWKSRWAKAVEVIGCDAEVTAAQAIVRVRNLGELASAHESWCHSRDRVASSKQRIEQFDSDVKSLQQKVALELESDMATLEVAQQLRAKLQEAHSLKQADDERRERRNEMARDQEDVRAEMRDLQTKLNHFLAVAGAKSLDGLDAIEQVSQLASKRADVRSNLERISAGADIERFIGEAETANADELEARITQFEIEIAELNTKYDQVSAEIYKIETKRGAFDGSDAAARADQRAMNCLSQIHAKARKYLTLKIAETILRQQVERYREENKDPLLSRASQYFAEMTCQEFSGLESDYDENGQPIIVGVRRSGDRVLTGGMSDGTLDPLFLSLRLAYLHEKVTQFEPMPFVVDDILIHLDDDRALATMKVLAEFSKSTQVLFFTHHQRLRELAVENLPDDVLTVHELERTDELRKAKRPR